MSTDRLSIVFLNYFHSILSEYMQLLEIVVKVKWTLSPKYWKTDERKIILSSHMKKTLVIQCNKTFAKQ